MIKLKDLLNDAYNPETLDKGHSYTYFLDLDGVLVDFDKAVKQLTGGIGFEDYCNINGKDKMWKTILSGGSVWWATLPWMPDGKKLWNTLKLKNITILTSGSKKYNGTVPEIGKKEWVFKNLGGVIKVIVTDSAHDKQRYSKPNSVLIDDMPSNIEEWKSRGGIGILHKNAETTIKAIESLNQ
jgi:hypothetical protein